MRLNRPTVSKTRFSASCRNLALTLFIGATCILPSLAESDTTKAANTEDSKGLQHIILGDKLAEIDLPPDFVFVPEAKAKEFMKKNGSSEEGIVGLVAPKSDKADYVVICRFEDVGYVNDDDAEKLNANDILQSYKEGTQEQNERRKEMNLPPIFVGNWAEQPHYDKPRDQVVWAIQVKDEDSPSAPVTSINYNTRMLGRRGVLSMNLVSDPSQLEACKPKVAELLKQTRFIKGQTYAEYLPGKDKSAGYGIAGLILGGGAMAAAAKFGVFGALWKWGIAAVLFLKKFVIIAVLGVVGIFKKLFGKKEAAAEPVSSEPVAPPPSDQGQL